MDPFSGIASIAMGLLGSAGQAATNRANQRMVREQMDFQERMSSTAAQRSVEDYRRAGLNPALAYERSASSPSGASATLGDVVGAGISSAQRAREVNTALQTAKLQQENLSAQTRKTAIEGRNAEVIGAELQRAYEFNLLSQPLDLRLKAANSILQESLIPGAQNQKRLDELMGIWGPAISTAKGATGLIQGLMPKVNLNTGGKTFILPPKVKP